MSSKCPRCGKAVYFAERQLYEGQDYHNSCVWAATKEKEAARGAPVFGLSEQIHCNPNDPKPWNAGAGGKAKPAGAGAGAGQFCTGCGTQAAGTAKFCGQCGNKF